MKTELIVALDFDSLEEVKTLTDSLGESVNYYKVGKQLFCREGKDSLRFLKAL